MTQFYEERPPQDQAYPDPNFGHRADQGTVEESVHRRIVKRMDHTRSPGLPDLPSSRSWGPIIIAACSMAIAVAALAFTWVSHSSTSTQISQLQSQVSQMGTALSRTADTKTVNNLSGKVNAIATVVNGISAYNTVCSQALTASSGQPAVYLFPCAQKG